MLRARISRQAPAVLVAVPSTHVLTVVAGSAKRCRRRRDLAWHLRKFWLLRHGKVAVTARPGKGPLSFEGYADEDPFAACIR